MSSDIQHSEAFDFRDWRTTDYREAWDRQKEIFDAAVSAKLAAGKAQNTLIFCEHPPVITIGKSGDKANLLFTGERLAQRGVAFYEIDRGGDVTFHGPGQIVGYPIFDLEQFHLGLKQYIMLLEESIIRLLALYGLKGERLESATGVWLDTDNPQRTRKICAIGVRSSRYVTMHGFALNVNTDLSYFSLIHPCGFIDKGVTSLQNELGLPLDMEMVKTQLLAIMQELFVIPL
ncbi:lipoyl(octanoyl) transferase LipB [Parabacteroides sp. FAFU027]|uniref:lipoyl(octanoyl) transferase LipB n=1 Tax=Parabacteroides sp. FAFU027 TaxID=2922715 RepID=UPI001FAF8B6C|nr:lipoyl(octanoyl) transferase LipB [Parabacteroides sp. FAFU027]